MSRSSLVAAAHLLLLILFTTGEKAVVSAQSSCSAAQRISAPFSVNPESLTAASGFINSFSVCNEALPPGLWFSYIPSKTTIVHFSMEAIDAKGYPAAMLILKGSCDSSLICVDRYFSEKYSFQADAGSEYFILLYRIHESDDDPFRFSLEELDPPFNDNVENAFSLTQEDLPYQGEFTTSGALSDFDQDACGLFGKYGVWFTYKTSLSNQLLVLRATTGNTMDVVGIQALTENGFVCVALGSTFGSTIEWTADANVQYYILVTDPSPKQSNGAFEFTLQSRGILNLPQTPDPPTQAPALEPGVFPTTPFSSDSSNPVPSPEGSPTTSLDPEATSPISAPEVPPSASEAFRLRDFFRAHLGLVVLFLIVV